MGNSSYNLQMLDSIDKQRYDRVVQIIEKFPDVLNEDLSSNVLVTPQGRAAGRCDMELCDILLKHGANPNNGGSSSITPIMWAAKRDNAYLVSNLVDAGADINLKSNEGFSALDYAIVHGNYRPALFLIEFHGFTLEYFDYYQFAKDRDYRYVNYEIFLTHLKMKTPYSNLPNVFKRPEKKRLIDPVVDPREGWKSMAIRMIDFQEPPVVERAELPEELQPQNRFWGKVRQKMNGLHVNAHQRDFEQEEGQNLQDQCQSKQSKHDQSIQIDQKSAI